ncbi:MAG: aspartate kinase, partial [Trebonia sp.]
MARNLQAPQILIKKFGGSSLATPAGVHRAVKIIADARGSGARIVTVVSARGRTTDGLIDLAAELNSAPEGREMDQLLATGEIASAALMAIALQGQGIPAVSLTAAQAGIQAFGPHGNGVVAQIGAARIFDLVSRGYVVVVAGFQGVDPEGDVITLGRGGSDTTAVELAVGLGQADCHIYTDVDGVYDADPRLVPSAQSLRTVDATVMTEMARAGAKVVHARAAEMAAGNNVRLHVKSTFGTGDGTVVN